MYWFHIPFYSSSIILAWVSIPFAELPHKSSNWSPCPTLLPFTLLLTSIVQIPALSVASLWTKSRGFLLPRREQTPSTAFKVPHSQLLQFYHLFMFYAPIKPKQDLNFSAASVWLESPRTLFVVPVAQGCLERGKALCLIHTKGSSSWVSLYETPGSATPAPPTIQDLG